ncbi:helix-turn-helix domain-containing protein [Membranihabitans marinus]|uniref:helix-turn-helix domain-containing protein n=1 Tax=Membranihabitans marinus TaxID=1227546 RepID=UPI001F3F87E0|nr:helix-turn-helix domain-containing protein [Membranihabitans marinus]
MSNYELDIAREFVQNTDQNLFLTGKAGTGKTTFLKEVIHKIRKKSIVVAPTGVAAINAGGTTIHSMFGLPLKAFVPANDPVDHNLANNLFSLSKHFRYRSEKRNLLRELELVVIDEISMVRADILDAIDYALRFVRRSDQAFGGVQLIVIGDLYQLSPVIKQDIWYQLQPYYRSGYFFDAYSWKKSNPVMIELKHIYRQTNADFIAILNRVRVGNPTEEDIQKLNEKYVAQEEDIPSNHIVLTTHNQKAQQINLTKMRALNTKVMKYKASVKGDFNENAYPVEFVLELKIGAQVMFTRNDSEGGKYFNGKIGEVVDLKKESVKVKFDDGEVIEVEAIQWENYTYKLNPETKEVEQEKLGSFSQFPLRLAWAITIHKSQGLTFENAVLDLGNSFAYGQAYVALSRCVDLQGISLKSKLKLENIKVDQTILRYSEQESQVDYDLRLHAAKEKFAVKVLQKYFDFHPLNLKFEQWQSEIKKRKENDLPPFSYSKIAGEIQDMHNISLKFYGQLDLYARHFISEDDMIPLKSRVQKGVEYYSDRLYKNCISSVTAFYEKIAHTAGMKKIQHSTIDFLAGCWDLMDRLYSVEFYGQSLYQGEQYKRPEEWSKTNLVKAKKKETTAEVSLKLLQGGMGVDEVAALRQLKASTIESHVLSLYKEKKLDIHPFVSKEKLVNILPFFENGKKEETLTDIHRKISFDVSFFELRMVRAYMERQ